MNFFAALVIVIFVRVFAYVIGEPVSLFEFFIFVLLIELHFNFYKNVEKIRKKWPTCKDIWKQNV